MIELLATFHILHVLTNEEHCPYVKNTYNISSLNEIKVSSGNKSYYGKRVLCCRSSPAFQGNVPSPYM
jgi:hypothetical protein